MLRPEQPLPLLIDQPLRFQDRELARVVGARVGVGAHEAVLAPPPVRLAGDQAGGQEAARLPHRERLDAVALVLDRGADGRRLSGLLAALLAPEQAADRVEHRSRAPGRFRLLGWGGQAAAASVRPGTVSTSRFGGARERAAP